MTNTQFTCQHCCSVKD